MALEGFETISFGNAGLTVSITKNGTTFNKSVVQKLGGPLNVVLMVNKDARQFAIRPATSKDTVSMPFCAGEKRSPSVRWNSKEFLRLLSGMMDWNLKEGNGFHVNGTYSSSDKAIIFDLNDAIPN